MSTDGATTQLAPWDMPLEAAVARRAAPLSLGTVRAPGLAELCSEEREDALDQ